jgi:hypothetical protein
VLQATLPHPRPRLGKARLGMEHVRPRIHEIAARRAGSGAVRWVEGRRIAPPRTLVRETARALDDLAQQGESQIE